MGGSLLLGPVPPAAGGSGDPVPLGGELLGRPGTVILPRPGMPPTPTGITATGWLVADLDTGEVLAAHDAHATFAPASTLKTLTALTLIPRLAPERTVTVTNADVDVDGSKVGLVPRQRYRIDQLFTALLVVSGNDAANTLASAAGGGSYTLALMNEVAARLQAGDTAARTVTGLDVPGQVTSAYDLALIARAAMRVPSFRRYVAVRRSFIPAPGGRFIEIDTHNKLLRHYAGAIGIKNGYTVASGASFVGAATRGGRTLLVTLLHANPLVWHEAAALLDWGFATGDRVTAVGHLVDPLPAASESTPLPAAASVVAPARGEPVRYGRPWWRHRPGLLLAAAGCLLPVALVLRRRVRPVRLSR